MPSAFSSMVSERLYSGSACPYLPCKSYRMAKLPSVRATSGLPASSVFSLIVSARRYSGSSIIILGVVNVNVGQIFKYFCVHRMIRTKRLFKDNQCVLVELNRLIILSSDRRLTQDCLVVVATTSGCVSIDRARGKAPRPQRTFHDPDKHLPNYL